MDSRVLHTSITYKNTANILARHHFASSTPKESKVLTKKEHHPQEEKREEEEEDEEREPIRTYHENEGFYSATTTLILTS